MSNTQRPLASILLALTVAACGSGTSKHMDGPMTHEEPDAGTTVEPEPNPDAGSMDAPIPIAVWVDDLVENYTSDQALPDTVDDKNIEDSDDPLLFDKYFQEKP